jgi:hypothetical protein
MNTLKDEHHITVRPHVAAKLKEVANKYILETESKYTLPTWLHRLYGACFGGRGYRTKGEWGLEVADKIVKQDFGELKKQISETIFATVGEDVAPFKTQINSLSPDQFKQLLNDVIFAKKQASSPFDSPKRLFYQALDESKKKLFDEALLARKDWYDQACNIVYSAEPKKCADVFKHFVTEKMKVLNNPDLINNEILEIARKSEEEERQHLHSKPGFNTLVAEAIKFNIDHGSSLKIGELFQKFLLRDASILHINVKKFLEELPKLISPEDYKKLTDAIDLAKLSGFNH